MDLGIFLVVALGDHDEGCLFSYSVVHPLLPSELDFLPVGAPLMWAYF